MAGRSERPTRDALIAGILAATCILLALSLVACKNVLNDDEDEAFHLRMLNLVADSPTLQFSVDTTVISTTGYLGVTGLSAAHPGNHSISFAAIRPPSLNADDEDDPLPIGGGFQETYAANRDYTVIAYGTVDNPKAFTIDLPSDKDDLDDDFIEYQFIDAAADVATFDVYITAPEGQITSPQKVTTLSFGQKSEPTKLKLFRRADVTDEDASLFVDLSIELRDPDSGDVLFKTGKLRYAERMRLLFAFADNKAPNSGPSKVKLVGIDGDTRTVLDADDRASLRVVHVSADSGAFDIFQGTSLNTPIVANLAFRDTSPYTNVDKGDVDLFAMPASSASIAILFVKEFTAIPNVSYSAYTVGPQGSVDAVVLTDNRRSVPTQSTFRFFNVAPSLEDEDALDVYVTLPGQALDFDSTDDSDATDNAGNFRRGTIGYPAATDFVTLKAGTYQVRMMPTGTSRIVLDTTVTVQEGSVRTYALIDDPETASLELMPVEEALTQ